MDTGSLGGVEPQAGPKGRPEEAGGQTTEAWSRAMRSHWGAVSDWDKDRTWTDQRTGVADRAMEA